MKILFVLLLALGCYANPTGSELKKTPTTAFDFTMVPSNDIKETLQDMIMVEIGKELFLERRKNNLWQCQTDQFGTAYCPTGLATARPYTAYYQSTTYERESAVMDYQTGFSVAGVGQVVDYINKEEDASSPAILMQKGVKAERAANGLYYTVVISSETTYGAKTTCSSLGSGWRLPQGNETGSGGVPVGGQEYVIPNYSNYCSGIGDFATLGDCAKYSLSPAVTNDWTSPRRNYRCVNTSPVNIVNGYVVISGYTVTKAGNGLYYTNVFPGKVPTGARDFCSSLGGEWRLPKGCETTGSGAVPVGGQEFVYTDSCACNTGYTLSTKSDCKGYKFGWGDVRAFRCVASNPNNVIHNTKCPSGYTDNGSNCKKTVNYAFYNYTCPSGYTVANSGLTSCPKTDPNITADNTSTLDDACNSATPPTGNCSKSISYKYYEYLCQAKNSFLEPIKNLNSGLKSPCAKSDPNNTIDNTGTLDDACNSSTPPVNNCQSTEYTCNSTLFKPVYVGGKWVCSPYLCNGNMKCGYGTCDLPTTPSATKYQDVAYNPLGTINDNRCNGDICDFVVNARVTYCESKQCPKGDDIIEKNGKCYKLECPKGTYLSGEKCIKVN